MKKQFVKTFVVLSLGASLLCGSCACGMAYTSYQQDKERKAQLIEFIEYCKTCDNLRQVDPNKDLSKSSLHELKTIARFYEEQEDFADCTDYDRQIIVDDIIGVKHDGRVITNN